MSKKITVPKKDKWRYNQSRAPGELKKPKGFESYFYTGPTLDFGHPNANKKKGKKS